jgi:hypothetical protein
MQAVYKKERLRFSGALFLPGGEPAHEFRELAKHE